MLVIVVIMFGVCWLFFYIFMLVCDFYFFFYYDKLELGIYFGVYWLVMFNSFVNLIIYSFINDSFRVGLVVEFYGI